MRQDAVVRFHRARRGHERVFAEDALDGVDATEDAIREAVSSFMGRDEVEFASVEIANLMAAVGKALANQKTVG